MCVFSFLFFHSVVSSSSLHKPIVDTASRILVHSLTPSLTLSLAPIITHALTRSPHEDYYCYYCETKQAYCQWCDGSRERGYASEYYARYYAMYYSRYYARFYSMVSDMELFVDQGHTVEVPVSEHATAAAGGE